MTARTYLSDRLRTTVVGTAAIVGLLAAVITSRSTDGAIGPLDLVLATAGIAAGLALFTWPSAVHEAAAEALTSAPVHAPAPAAPTPDITAPHQEGTSRGGGDQPGGAPSPNQLDDRLWRPALGAAGLAALWATAGAIVVAAALGTNSASAPVAIIALVALAGSALVAVDHAGRATGLGLVGRRGRAHAAGALVVVPVRRRAWRTVAAPLAAIQLVLNAVLAWLLFGGHSLCGALGVPVTARGEVLADSLIIVVALAASVGAVARRIGEVDARTAKVALDEDLRAVADRTRPLGGQALVYAAGAGLLLAKGASYVLPAQASLWRVVVVRGLFAAVVSFVVAGLAYVRGALNGAAGVVPVGHGTHGPSPARPARPSRWRRTGGGSSPDGPRRTRRRPAGSSVRPGMAMVALAAVAALAVVAAPVTTVASQAAEVPAADTGANAGSDPGVAGATTATSAVTTDLDDAQISAEAAAFGVRVEYDIPAPVGTGTLPSVVGEIRRFAGGDNAKGLAAAPSELDLVVGGVVADPDGTPGSGDENRLPQTECFYPGDLLATTYRFPTDLNPSTGSAPALSYATAHCAPGPEVELAAAVTSTAAIVDGSRDVASVGAATAEALLRPVDGVLHADARASTADVSLLGGLIRVGSISAVSSSSVTGRPGEAASESFVELADVRIGPVTLSLRGGDLHVAGLTVPVASPVVRTVLATVNGLLAATGCTVDLLSQPATYPQGFVMARKEPVLGIDPDGAFAGSMVGGLHVVCDLPPSLSDLVGFTPSRVQVLLGFAFTAAAAADDVGGFDLGDLGADPVPGADGGGLAGLGAGGFDGGLGGFDALGAGAFGSDGFGDLAGAVPLAGPSAPAAPSTGALGGVGDLLCTGPLRAANWIADHRWSWPVALAGWAVLTQVGAVLVSRRRRAALGAVAPSGAGGGAQTVGGAA